MIAGGDPNVIRSLTARSARLLADYYRQLIVQLEAHADQLERDERASERRWQRFGLSKSLWRFVETEIAGGLDYHDAVRAVADKTPFDENTIRVEHQRAARKRKRLKLESRNVEIMRLARRGWTDAEIGKKLSLHPKSVSRIIRDILLKDRAILSPGAPYVVPRDRRPARMTDTAAIAGTTDDEREADAA